MIRVLFIACVITAFTTWGQNTSLPTGKSSYGSQYNKPEFPGDVQAFIAKNLHYPEVARENGVEGRLLLRFMITDRGEVTNIKVVRGLGAGCDEEAMRVAKAMPLWMPATYKGRAVSAVDQVQVTFKLE